LFSFSDLVLLRTYARLLESGVSVKRLKKAHKTWSRQFKTLEDGAPPTRFLLTDGQNVLLRTPEDALIDLSSDGQFVFSFIVDLHQVRDEVIHLIKSA